MAFSPDGSTFAAGGDYRDGSVWLWRTSDGQLQWERPTSAGGIDALAFSPNGSVLAYGGGYTDSTITLRSVADGSLSQTLYGHRGPVTGLAFSPDGSLLLSAGYDGTVRFWDFLTGAPLVSYGEETRGAKTVAMAPGGSQFAYGRSDATLAVARTPGDPPLVGLRLVPTPAGPMPQLLLMASPGQPRTLQVSSNLVQWTNWQTLTPSNRVTLIPDSTGVSWPSRFYRVGP